MGGAAGHFLHPLDDYELKVSEFKEMLKAIVSNKICLFEKTDGVNLHITMQRGKLLFARNKGSIREPKTIERISDNVPVALAKYLTVVMEELQERLLSIRYTDFLDDMFLNIEVLGYDTRIYQYGDAVQFHWMASFDNGEMILKDQEVANNIATSLQLNTSGKFKIYGKNQISIKDSKLTTFEHAVASNELICDFPETETLYDIVSERLIKLLIELGYGYSSEVMSLLARRWLLKDKSINLKEIKKMIIGDNNLTEIDKKDRYWLVRLARFPLDVAFRKWEAEILKTPSGDLLSQSTNKQMEDLYDSLLIRAENMNISKTNEINLKLLISLGKYSLMRYEGVVFEYNNKIYKMTGAYSPANIVWGVVNGF